MKSLQVLREEPGRQIRGTPERDDLFGGFGDDTVKGLAEDDILEGGFGNDSVLGGKGNDLLVGYGPKIVATSLPPIAFGANFDELTGGKGADTFVLDSGVYQNRFYSGRGHAVITDFSRSQGDQLQIRGTIDEYRVVTRKNYGGSEKQDSAIYNGRDLIAIAYDVTNLKPRDFISVELESVQIDVLS